MPTYSRAPGTGQGIQVPNMDRTGNIILKPGDVGIETPLFLDLTQYPDVTKTSDEPLYNPLISETFLSFITGGPGDQQTVIIDPSCEIIVVQNVIGSLIFYIQLNTNIPAKEAPAMAYFYIYNDRTFNQLIFEGSEGGKCTVAQLKRSFTARG